MAQKKGLTAGWYPDPDVSARWRWWDGSAWTQWLSSTRDQTFPPPGGATVVPVPTRRDKVTRWVWVVVAVLTLAMVVMAGVGVAVNQRRDAARPAPSWARTVSPAPTRSPADGYDDLWASNKGLITLERTISVQAPNGDGWTFPDEGESTDLSPFFDPVIIANHASTVTAGGSNGSLFVGVPEQALIPETIEATSTATALAFVQSTWGGDQNQPTDPTVRTSRALPGLGERLVAHRVTLDFQSRSKDEPIDMVMDMTFYQTGSDDWFVVAMVIGGEVEDELTIALEETLATVRLVEA